MSEFVHLSSFEPSDQKTNLGPVKIDAVVSGSRLIVSISNFGVLVMPDTIEGGQLLVRDIESLKHHLALAQRAINDHLGKKITGEGS